MIKQSLGDELPNNADFAQEVRKLYLREQFQRSDSFIFIRYIYIISFQQLPRLEKKNNNYDARQIQSLQQSVSHCNQRILSKHIDHFTAYIAYIHKPRKLTAVLF